MEHNQKEQLMATYARMEWLEPTLHALLTTVKTDGNPSVGPLAGLIATIKDVIVTEGIATTAGSTMLEGWIPPYDATVVARLKEAGVTIIGKTNCDAWAHGSSTENSDYGPTKNPWDTTRVPGGSSGGSAAAMVAGYGDFSMGTDTGGSIRQPAAFCGVTGLKPTYGRVSRSGLIAMASSFDCPGPLARDALTCARVLEVIAGHDPLDATSVPHQIFRAAMVTKAPENAARPLMGLKIGLPKEYFAQGLDRQIESAVRQAVDQLETLGAVVRDVSIPSTPTALAAYYVLIPAEVSSNLARFDGIRYGHSAKRSANSDQRIAKSGSHSPFAIRHSPSHIELVKQNRAEGFGDEAKRRIILGTFVLSAGYVDAYYKQAMRVRTLLRQEFARVFQEVDLLATPVTPNLAFKLGQKTTDPLTMYLEDIYTISANLVGIPALSLPCGFAKPPDGTQELPIGLQLLGPMFGEAMVLRTAHQYQQVTDWHTRRPPLIEQIANSK